MVVLESLDKLKLGALPHVFSVSEQELSVLAVAEVFHPYVTTGCNSILLAVDTVDILGVRVRQSKDVGGKVTG